MVAAIAALNLLYSKKADLSVIIVMAVVESLVLIYTLLDIVA
jgi:hypothetical protein